MSANKKPRKAYRRKGVLLDTMAYVKESLTPLHGFVDSNAILRIRCHDAVAALQAGKAGAKEIDSLVQLSNMSMSLKKLNLGRGYHDEVCAGADAVESLRNRWNATGKAVAWADELTAVNMLLAIHDAQLDASTLQTIERAVKLTNKKQAVAV
jgi:hypothetical protein